MNKKEKILITGCAGFIGMHLSKKLLEDGYDILGLDNLNNYYDSKLKKDRLEILEPFENFSFEKVDISSEADITNLFKKYKPDKVVNLAAQAGVRYSIEEPSAYISSNIIGFMNVLECCRYNKVKGLIYASSSSVYGNNKEIPFSVEAKTDKPISIYAATKKSNELMAYSYSHLYKVPTTGLRFFTVYGPWGRPDMAFSLFTDKIMNNIKLNLFNYGEMFRDFTYIDDIVEGIVLSLNKNHPCSVFNMGSSNSIKIVDLINLIETKIGKKAKIKLLGMQPGDVKKTLADISYTQKILGYEANTSLKKGVFKFLDWYISYYG
jgi:UDP-glucuronate 4-epimerase